MWSKILSAPYPNAKSNGKGSFSCDSGKQFKFIIYVLFQIEDVALRNYHIFEVISIVFAVFSGMLFSFIHYLET